jgi:hypothetical protein
MVHISRSSVDDQSNSPIKNTENEPLHQFRRHGGKGAPGRVRGSNEPASLVAAARRYQLIARQS